MQVSMSELNKRANSIINQVAETGETVTVIKHGKAVAEIISVNQQQVAEDAIEYFLTSIPIKVKESIGSVVALGRKSASGGKDGV